MFRFLFGIALGFGIGTLIAPQSGEELRRGWMERAEDKVADVVQMGRERAVEMARESVEKTYDQVAEKAVGSDVVDRSRRA